MTKTIFPRFRRLTLFLLLLLVLLGLTVSTTQAAPAESNGVYHTVRYGETLSLIAVTYGVTIHDLLVANPHIVNPNLIYYGTVIFIPYHYAPPPQPPPPPPPQHGLPEEDGLHGGLGSPTGRVDTRIGIVAFPHVSNLDEFQPLQRVPGVQVVWVRAPAQLQDWQAQDWIILAGSKSTAADLAWLRPQGLDRVVAHHPATGVRVLGICGGLQMLGEALIDPHGIDGNGPGLGLLPLVTVFAHDKTVRRSEAAFGTVAPPWQDLSALAVRGYEIHHGQTAQHPAMAAAGDLAQAVQPGLGW